MLYELLYIVSGNYSEKELEPIIKQVGAVIQKYEGVVKETDNLGKKKLAYQIKQNHQGYYILSDLDLPTTMVNEINKTIKIIDGILRHQIVKKSEVTMKPLIQHRARQTVELKPIIDSPTETVIPTSPSATPISPPKSEPTKKVDLEELDKKIDEILKKDLI